MDLIHVTRPLIRKKYGDRHVYGDHHIKIMHKLGCCIYKLRGKELLGKHQKPGHTQNSYFGRQIDVGPLVS